MKTQVTRNTLLALILIVFLVGILPSGSFAIPSSPPTTPTIPSDFPDSNVLSGGGQPADDGNQNDDDQTDSGDTPDDSDSDAPTTLTLTNPKPNDRQFGKGELVQFNATVDPVGNSECKFNIPELFVTKDAVVSSNGLVSSDHIFNQDISEKTTYGWNFTCTDNELEASIAAEVEILLNPLLFEITSLATDKDAYDSGEKIEFSAQISPSSPLPTSCNLTYGINDVEETVHELSPAETLNYEVGAITESGEYSYRITCALNQQTINSETKTFAILPTLSILELSPEDDAELGYGEVTFTATLSLGTGVTCELGINDKESREMDTSDDEATNTINFDEDLAGDYDWSVTCEANGEKTTSKERTLTILDEAQSLLNIDLDDDFYLLGETIELEAKLEDNTDYIIELFMKGEKVRENKDEEETNAFGELSYEFDIPLDYEEGEYYFLVTNKDNDSETGEAHFEMGAPRSSLTLSPRIIEEGDTVRVIGAEWFADSTVKLELLEGTSTRRTETIETNRKGDFTHDLEVNEAVGTYTVEVTQEGLTETQTLEVVEEAPERIFYRDADDDGYGDAAVTREASTQPPGYVDRAGDCDDNRASVNPGANEACDGVDNNCDALVDTGDLCSGDKECSAGQCKVAQTTPVNSPGSPTNNPPALPPITESPNPTPIPSFREEEGSNTLWWILLPLLLIILLAGGFIGFVAYEGYLDTSSWAGFITGMKKAMGLEEEKKEALSVLVPQGDYQLLSKFITTKRQEGYDDLTIRNSLIKKGWKEGEVDSVFDDLYQ